MSALDRLFDAVRRSLVCRCQARSRDYCECGAGDGLDALDVLEREVGTLVAANAQPGVQP